MNRIFLFCALSILGFSRRVASQPTIHPLFKELEFANYEKDKNGPFSIEFYFSIDSSAQVVSVEIHKADTVYCRYTLPDSIIASLNFMYADGSPLQSLMVRDHLKGAHYAGDYSFIALRRMDNKLEYLTFVYGFMDDRYQRTVESIFKNYWAEKNERRCQKFQIDQSFLKQLFEHHNQAKNLPEKEAVPLEDLHG